MSKNRKLRGSVSTYLLALAAVGLSLGFVSTVAGQAIQLPVINTFGVRTTVNVPDGGSIRLGGISTRRAQSTSRGVPLLSGIPFANRGFRTAAISKGSTSSGMTLHVTIIDLDQLDHEVLAEAARRRAIRYANASRRRPPPVTIGVQQKAAFLSKHIGRSK